MLDLQPLVMKFGGTSVEDADAFVRVAEIVSSRLTLNPVVVVSAMSGFTDALLRSTQDAAAGDLRQANADLDLHIARHFTVAGTFPPDERNLLVTSIEHARREIDDLLTAIANQNQNSSPFNPELIDAVLSYG